MSLTEIDPALSDGRETDAPLSNTRISSAPGISRGFVSRIRNRFITSRMWLRRVPRRHLAAVAVVLGTAAGAGLMFMVTRSKPPSDATVASPVSPIEVIPTPPAAPTPTVFVEDSAPKPDPTTVESAANVASTEDAAPSASASAGKGSKAGARTPARLPVRKVAKGRDYGI